ncbi:MAG: hypothetical protein L6E13_03820 [Firmicutes bacterium]|nr:hypothetical protein [Bacillota bacterium]
MAQERTPSPTAHVLGKARTGESWSHAALQSAYRAGGSDGEATGDVPTTTAPAAVQSGTGAAAAALTGTTTAATASHANPAWFTAPAAVPHRAASDEAPMGPAPGGWC